MIIPKSFCIAGGQKHTVEIVDNINHSKYGDFSDAECKIRLARTINVEGEEIELTQEAIERCYLHELAHAFNYAYNCECDEALAQAFSNFMYEYLKTKEE